MDKDRQIGTSCGEFEALLVDLLDGALSGSRRESFEAHRGACANCAALAEEAAAGRNWLRELRAADAATELPPALVGRILRATSGRGAAPSKPSGETWIDRLWRMPVMQTVVAVRQPRFALSFAMAFFSVALLLNLAGMRLRNLGSLDLNVNALVRSYYESQGKLIKYYDNLGFVYEIESRVRDLQRATSPEPNRPQDGADTKDKGSTRKHPGSEKPSGSPEPAGNFIQEEKGRALAHAATSLRPSGDRYELRYSC